MFFHPPAPPPQDTVLEETVVTAPRSELPVTTSAAKVTVVTGEELARTGERSLPRALGLAAGVWIQESNLGGGAPVLRGLLGNQVLIMLDGVRLNDATTRFGPNQDLNSIDPAIVDRVEVIHGSSSVLYGSDAIGGVIAVWTRRRAPEPGGVNTGLEGAASGLYDSATDGERVTLEASDASTDFGWLGVGSYEDWGDLEAGDDVDQPFTGYRGSAGFASAEWLLDGARSLRATAMVHRDFDVPRTFSVVPGFGQDEASFAKYDFALQQRELGVLTYDDREAGGLADRFQLRLFARRYIEQRERRKTGSTVEEFRETRVSAAGLGADWMRDLGGGHVLTWGLDLESDDVDSFGLDTDLGGSGTNRAPGDFAPDARYSSFGAFVQDEIATWAPTYLTLGLRWSYFDFAFDDGADRERGDFDDLTASLELAHDVSDTVRVTATLAQGFQAPNLEDLANDGDFSNGTELANPDLDPAESLMAEVGVDVLGDAWAARGAVFATRIDSYIGRRLLDEGDPGVVGDELYQRDNAGRLDLWGIELGASRELGGPWSLDLVASWVRGRQYDDAVDPNTGERPLDGVDARRIPPLNGNIALRWRDPKGPTWLDEGALLLRWAADQDLLNPDDVGDPRIDPEGTDAWSTWNVELGGPLGSGIRWNLSLVNLLDEFYRVHGSGVAGPGRSVLFGVRASF